MPLPSRESIKSALISLINERGSVTASEAYRTLAAAWQLSAQEQQRMRGGRRLYEHEIRWARQELVIEGVLERARLAGGGAWRLARTTPVSLQPTMDNVGIRMVRGFLNPTTWFVTNWLPRYQAGVDQVERALAAGAIDQVAASIWSQRDNGISDAGHGVLSSRQVSRARDLFRRITLAIMRDPTPTTFDGVLLELEQARAQGALSKIPRLLVARAFATVAPNRYHTTVHESKHDRVIEWFEKHSSFRSSPGNWAHRAAELTVYLGGIRELRDSILLRNMFPWFIFSQLTDTSGRPVFAPGHRCRVSVAEARVTGKTNRVVLRHNVLVEALYRKLTLKHGSKAVGTEQPSGLGGFVDVVVRIEETKYWLYEVKVAETAADAIRQALGQLLEYAYRPGAWEPARMFVVGEPALDRDSKRFLSRLRREFRLPIEYQQIVV